MSKGHKWETPFDFNETVRKIIVEEHGTLKNVADVYGVCKLTVGNRVHTYTKETDPNLYAQVVKILKENESAFKTNIFRNEKYSVKEKGEIFYTKSHVEKIVNEIAKIYGMDFRIELDEYGDAFLIDDKNCRYFMLIHKGGLNK